MEKQCDILDFTSDTHLELEPSITNYRTTLKNEME